MKVDRLLSLFSDFKWGWSFDNGFKLHPITAFYLMKGNVNIEKIKIQESEIIKYDFFSLIDIPDNTFECCKEKARLLAEYIRNLKR